MNTSSPPPPRAGWQVALNTLCCLALALPAAAWASTPAEKVVCTTAPRSTWLTEAQARTAFNASAYVLVRFKVSRGNCHEFYAIDAQGAVVEAYQHPVTGETVRSTRIAPTQAPTSPPPALPSPSSAFFLNPHLNAQR